MSMPPPWCAQCPCLRRYAMPSKSVPATGSMPMSRSAVGTTSTARKCSWRRCGFRPRPGERHRDLLDRPLGGRHGRRRRQGRRVAGAGRRRRARLGAAIVSIEPWLVAGPTTRRRVPLMRTAVGGRRARSGRRRGRRRRSRRACPGSPAGPPRPQGRGRPPPSARWRYGFVLVGEVDVPRGHERVRERGLPAGGNVLVAVPRRSTS